ncbi:MAG: 16S rRNA (guanine(966)-N(2))-methyltransferase RsmD [Deltaproteobacteria bacterium]|nr:16S rRNA (guanine(966)-N(2))-methyltransferase RsmD [Deltaproteobacteria bacterium]
MRVVAGLARGRKIVSIQDASIRPTTGTAREALFNILGNIEGEVFCDLFSGTGAVGIEALSRRASKVIFVDNNPHAIKAIRENVALCGFSAQSVILSEAAEVAVRRLRGGEEAFDVVFADPPYAQGALSAVLALFSEGSLIKNEGKLIVQHAPYDQATPHNGALLLTDRRKYGRTVFSFYQTS